MVVNGRLTKVNERAGSLQGQRMRVRVRQHVVGRLSVAVHIQCVPAVCHRSFIFGRPAEMSSEENTTHGDEGDVAPPFSAEQLAWIDRLISARQNAPSGDSGAAGGDSLSPQTSSSGSGKVRLLARLAGSGDPQARFLPGTEMPP